MCFAVNNSCPDPAMVVDPLALHHQLGRAGGPPPWLRLNHRCTSCHVMSSLVISCFFMPCPPTTLLCFLVWRVAVMGHHYHALSRLVT